MFPDRQNPRWMLDHVGSFRMVIFLPVAEVKRTADRQGLPAVGHAAFYCGDAVQAARVGRGFRAAIDGGRTPFYGAGRITDGTGPPAIGSLRLQVAGGRRDGFTVRSQRHQPEASEIGRASCRERV